MATEDISTGAEQPGTLIGPYKLLEQIGEGGMGVVYVAEQTEPVRRRVALKIIKPGLDTNQVIARFEEEHQALAMMDHPHIAKVLDAGTTDADRPYFVMEARARAYRPGCFRPSDQLAGRDSHPLEIADFMAYTFCGKFSGDTAVRPLMVFQISYEHAGL